LGKKKDLNFDLLDYMIDYDFLNPQSSTLNPQSSILNTQY